MEEANQFGSKAIDFLYSIIPHLALAIVTLLVGIWIIKVIVKFVRKRFEKRNVDVSLRGFLVGGLRGLLYILLIISVASMVGINTTSFIAVIGAAGLAVGLALQGSLANFAGGVLILLFRPFRVGQFIISDNNVMGSVEKIDILYTTLRTPEGITVYAPNGPLANAVISNYSNIQKRRVEYVIGISYDSDIKKARQVISEVLNNEEKILGDPGPQIVVSQLGESSVDMTIRFWAPNADYWPIYFQIRENIKEALDANNISIPFPQRDVRVINQNGGQ